jgi:hypothetical protein
LSPLPPFARCRVIRLYREYTTRWRTYTRYPAKGQYA